jgi:hypothetical protein
MTLDVVVCEGAAIECDGNMPSVTEGPGMKEKLREVYGDLRRIKPGREG